MTQRIIIFDGPDCCGKTNMAIALAIHLGIPYFKNSLEHDNFGIVDSDYFVNASRYIDTYMTEFLRQTQTSVIFDRNFPSEFVYPKIFGRKIDVEMLRKIDNAHAELGTKIIVPYRTSYVGIYDPVDNQITPDKLVLLDECYQQFCAWTGCDVFRLNVDDEDLGRELEEIIKFISI